MNTYECQHCGHVAAEHHKVGPRMECFQGVREGWLCSCMDYTPWNPPVDPACECEGCA